jgi:hypothetical protein
VIAFGKTMTIYDFSRNVFIELIEFNSEIVQIFSHKKKDVNCVGVILKSGDIYIDELKKYPLSTPTYSSKGTLSQFELGDANDNSFIVNYNGTAYMEFEDNFLQLKIDGLSSTSNIVKITYPAATRKETYII